MATKSKSRSPSDGKALSPQEVLTAAAAASRDLKKLALNQPHHKEQMQDIPDMINKQIQQLVDFQITHAGKNHFIKQSSRTLITLREALDYYNKEADWVNIEDERHHQEPLKIDVDHPEEEYFAALDIIREKHSKIKNAHAAIMLRLQKKEFTWA